MPRWAISKRPFLLAWAPVKAPRTWPKSSLSSSVSGRAAQFWVTKRASLRASAVVDRPRDEILAGAGLPDDQHGRVGLRDLLHHVEDAVHGGARRDDLVEAVPALDLAAQVEVLGAQALVGVRQSGRELDVLGGELVGLERALHVEPQLVGLPRLRDEAVDPPFVDRAREGSDVRVAREHHADRLRVALDRLLEELDTAHRGQHLVGDDERDVLALEDLEPLFTAGRREDAVIGSERQLEGLEDRRLVVDDEDAVGVGAGLGSRAFDRPDVRHERCSA